MTEHRKIGKDIFSLPVGLGCMGMSDFYVTKDTRDDKESLATLDMAIEKGIQFLDTGDFYGAGHNEMLVGQAIRGRRDKVFLSVKFGVLRSPSGMFLGLDNRPQAVKNFVTYTLQRLGVDHIDLYQPARISPEVPIEDTVGAIADLVKEGKVRYLGLSEVNAAQLEKANAVHPVAALQIEYSLATRLIERNLLAAARKIGASVVAYGVLSRALLAAPKGGFAPADFRAHLPRFTGENLQRNLAKVQVLHDLAEKKGVTAPQLAIAWVLHQGGDILPLIGTSKRARLEENLKAIDVSLSAPELDLLDKAFPEGAFAGERYPEQQMHVVAK